MGKLSHDSPVPIFCELLVFLFSGDSSLMDILILGTHLTPAATGIPSPEWTFSVGTWEASKPQRFSILLNNTGTGQCFPSRLHNSQAWAGTVDWSRLRGLRTSHSLLSIMANVQKRWMRIQGFFFDFNNGWMVLPWMNAETTGGEGWGKRRRVILSSAWGRLHLRCTQNLYEQPLAEKIRLGTQNRRQGWNYGLGAFCLLATGAAVRCRCHHPQGPTDE